VFAAKLVWCGVCKYLQVIFKKSRILACRDISKSILSFLPQNRSDLLDVEMIEAATTESDPALKRLLELKALYQQQKAQLPPGDSPIKTNAKPVPSSSTITIAQGTRSSSEESDSDSNNDLKKNGPKKHKKGLNGDTIDQGLIDQLEPLIKQTIIDHGGSSHVDTIAEFIKLHFAHQLKKDGLMYSNADFRKVTVVCLKNSTAFCMESEFENCWAINESIKSDVDLKFPDTVPNLIAQVIEAKSGVAAIEEIFKFVNEKYNHKITEDAVDDVIKDTIKITLNTNPRFKKREKRRNVFFAKNTKKKINYNRKRY